MKTKITYIPQWKGNIMGWVTGGEGSTLKIARETIKNWKDHQDRGYSPILKTRILKVTTKTEIYEE